jgi:hypothetical protein
MHYSELWERFVREGRVEPTPRPTRGRHFMAQVVAIVNDPTLFRRLDRIRQAVAGFPGAVPVPDHFLHLPILELGPVAPRGARPGEWSARDLASLAERGRQLLAEVPAFPIEIASVNATASEVFAELHPPEQIAELRARLQPLRPAAGGPGGAPRLPLAHFTRVGNGTHLAHTLEWFRNRPIGRIRVAQLTVIVVHARRLHPARHRLAELPLGRAGTA